MTMPPVFLLCLSVLLLAITTSSQLTDAPQTVDRLSAYLALRSCAQLCFWQPYPGNFRSDAIASYLSCTQPSIYSGAFESCWCRPDYQGDVVEYISSCVSQKCETQPGDYKIDVSRAASVYEGYCASAVSRGGDEGTVTPASTRAKETGGISPFTDESTTAIAKTSLVETVPIRTGSLMSMPTTTTMTSGDSRSTNTAPPETSTNKTTQGGLSAGKIAGIVVGAIGAVILAVILWVGARSERVRKKLGWTRDNENARGRTSTGIYTADGLPVRDGVVHGDGRPEMVYLPGAREGV